MANAAKVGGDQTVEVGKELTVVAGTKLVLRAGQELRIEVGSASLVLKANGEIQLRGNRVTIEGSAEVHIKGANVHTNSPGHASALDVVDGHVPTGS